MASKGKGGMTVAAVQGLAEQIAAELGLRIWDVTFTKEGASYYLRIFIDKDEGVSIDDCEAECKDLNEQIGLLKGRIEAIQKGRAKNRDYKEKLNVIEREIDSRKATIDIYNDTVVRQIVECIKIFADGRQEVYFGGGNMVEEHL